MVTGTLLVWRRPDGYVERRSDGYREPQLVFLVGTAHVSPKSACDVRRVVQVWQGVMGTTLGHWIL